MQMNNLDITKSGMPIRDIQQLMIFWNAFNLWVFLGVSLPTRYY